MTAQDWLQGAIDGVGDGAIIASGAVGLVLVARLTGVVNLAHGEVLSLGALVAASLSAVDGVPAGVALLTGAVACAALLVVGHVALWKPLIGRGHGTARLAVVAFGAALAMRGAAEVAWGTSPRAVDGLGSRWQVGAVDIAQDDVIALGVATVGVAACVVIARRGAPGSHIWGWALAGALAGVAGGLAALDPGARPDLGFALLPAIAAAAAVGGLTRIGPTVGAALAIGVAQSVVVRADGLPAGTAPAIAAGVLLVALAAAARARGARWAA